MTDMSLINMDWAKAVLDSDLTAYRVAKDTGIPVSTVRKVKKGDMAIEKLTGKQLLALQDYYLKLDAEQKGKR